MKHAGKIVLCLAGGLVWSASLSAAAPDKLSDNPYAIIAARNVFGLNPPPPPPDPLQQAEKDLPKITPMGIYSVFDHWKVIFKVTQSARPGQKAEDKYYDLSEGEGQDNVEIVNIDNQNSIVTFKNHGIEQKLPLVASSTVASGPTPAPAASSPPGMMRPPLPTFRPGNLPGGGPMGAPISTSGAPGSPGVEGGAAGGVPLNFGGPTGRTYQPPPLPPNVRPEDIPILIEANRAMAEQQGNPAAKLFPPTALTPLINQEKNDAANGQP
jgi:hypothetical protein